MEQLIWVVHKKDMKQFAVILRTILGKPNNVIKQKEHNSLCLCPDRHLTIPCKIFGMDRWLKYEHKFRVVQ